METSAVHNNLALVVEFHAGELALILKITSWCSRALHCNELINLLLRRRSGRSGNQKVALAAHCAPSDYLVCQKLISPSPWTPFVALPIDFRPASNQKSDDAWSGVWEKSLRHPQHLTRVRVIITFVIFIFCSIKLRPHSGWETIYPLELLFYSI